MDLEAYAIILIIFLVSFMSYLFISKLLPHGKSFDEMIAEKKRMREELLGTVKSVASGKQSNIGGKKKPKKEVKKKEIIQVKLAKEVTKHESDASESSEIVRTEPVIQEEIVNQRKTVTKTQQASQVVGKKNKGKGGILINKNELILVKEAPVEESNHFEEIIPKDVVEIHRASVKDETDKKSHIRDVKKGKMPKLETPPISPKNQLTKDQKGSEEKQLIKKKRNELSISPVDTGGSGFIALVSDETGITPLIRELNRADLTKSQMQVLIDFLLNKQSDTLTHEPTEWTEGKSDMVQKLKKQLQEKEEQLKNEQDALIGMQMKLKELRSEFNTEKIQFSGHLKAHTEQLHNNRLEIKTLQSEIQFLNDKHNTEKQSMSVSFKQLQGQCIQMKEAMKAHEGLPNAQQLQKDNQTLQQELAMKKQQILDLNPLIEENRKKDDQIKQMLAENNKKISEFDALARRKDERCAIVENELRQREQELTSRDSEIQKLNTELTRAKELDKIIHRQIFELEQLKKQLSEQQQNNHAEESNKIEIRNLQNALDSSNKELEVQRLLVSDFKVKFEDLNKQLAESKLLTNSKSSGDSFLLNEMSNHQSVISQKDKQLADYQQKIETLQKAENDLIKQIEEQKVKNNDLRTKNWKLVEALQTAQSSSLSKSANSNFPTNNFGLEVSKVKNLFTQNFPEAVSSATSDSDDTKWLESVLENLKSQLVSNKSLNRTSTASSNASATANNNINNNKLTNNNNHLNNCSGVETNNLNNSTVNGDSNSSTSSAADNEIVLLQNAQLKTTIEEYKNIIAETESMLKNLESKVREQDAYWTKVVLMKDNEIESLKNISEKS
ncbi:CLUMA_CG012585, isoform A [Clunio marinus]|uniref:CLUMA_CG012585, isoform A n=1 Tax=Clunio marinus TaxID=568069 RepID=A0A1J1IGR5_9DIPT|nr:CLUMA_CG012585, isoform A [Clunio marinus]